MLTKAEARVVAELLQRAKDEFSNRGCNDFNLAEVVSDPQEQRELLRAMWEDDRGPQATWHEDDLEHFAHQLRAELREAGEGAELRGRLLALKDAIEQDSRYQAPPVAYQANAPLAGIRAGMAAKVEILDLVLQELGGDA